MKRANQLQLLDTRNETEMIAAVVAFLTGRGYKVWRQQNRGQFDVISALDKLVDALESRGTLCREEIEEIFRHCWMRIPDSVRGVADVIGWHLKTGVWIAVEVKIGADKVSDAQHQWLTDLKKANGEVYICRDFEQFIQTWERQNVKFSGEVSA